MFPSPANADALPPAELARLLRWYAEMGVDIAVDEAPHDRFADGAKEMARAAAATPVLPPAPLAAARSWDAPPQRLSAPPAAALTQEAAVETARQAAGAAKTLEELRAALEAFDGSSLKRRAGRLVFDAGNPKARIMMVGGAPGDEEDRQGAAFIGRAGQLLDKMLASIGLDRAQVYLANVVPWRPPGNQTPSAAAIAVCLPFLERQIALANPDILVCMGDAAVQGVLGLRDSAMRARGGWFDYTMQREGGARRIQALAMPQPDYLLKSQTAKRFAWSDLRALKKAVDALV